MPIDFACSACGKKYRVKDELAGRTAKCSQCNASVKIPGAAHSGSAAKAAAPAAAKPAAPKAAAPQQTKSPPPTAASRPIAAPKPADELSSWFDAELPVAAAAPVSTAAPKLGVAAKSAAMAAAPTAPRKSTLCPSCRVPLATGAVICVACGYDVRKGEKLATKKGDDDGEKKAKKSSALRSSASYGRGILLSTVGAMIGAAIWAGIGIALQIEIGYVAIGLGALAGIGMAAGHEDQDGTLAGIIAAGIAIVGIVAAKFIILQYMKTADLGEGISLAAVEQMTGQSIPLSVMFSPIDGLFILLAVGAAYQLASGQATD